MTDYTKATNFATKDALVTGDPLKVVKGTEIDDELNAIEDAIETKANIESPTFTGVPKAPTAAAGTSTTQLATTAFVQNGLSDLPDNSIGADELNVNGDGIAGQFLISDGDGSFSWTAISVLSPSATDPTTRDDGTDLEEGDQYYNTTDDVNKYYDGTNWVSLHTQYARTKLGYGINGNTVVSSGWVTTNGGASWSYLSHTSTGTDPDFSATFISKYVNGAFYTTNLDSDLYRSTDGTTWTKVYDNTTTGTYINDITSNGNTVVAVGHKGKVYTSTDNGVTWSVQTVIDTASPTVLETVVYDDGKFVTASTSDIAYSTDGSTWTVVENAMASIDGGGSAEPIVWFENNFWYACRTTINKILILPIPS